MNDKQQQNEVARLTGLLCDGQISESEMEQLDRLLAGDPAARSVYREYLTLDVALAWAMSGNAREADADRPHAPVAAASARPSRSPVLGFLRLPGEHRELDGTLFDRHCNRSAAGFRRLGRNSLVGTAQWGPPNGRPPADCKPRRRIHALVFPALAFWKNDRGAAGAAGSPNCPGRRFRPGSATRAAVDVRRANGTEPVNVGGQLAMGQKVQIESGLAEVIFPKGVNLVLQGPASLTIESDQSVFLAKGRLTAR